MNVIITDNEIPQLKHDEVIAIAQKILDKFNIVIKDEVSLLNTNDICEVLYDLYLTLIVNYFLNLSNLIREEQYNKILNTFMPTVLEELEKKLKMEFSSSH